ncbi:MAG: biotin/lipoyl-containing protein [archaeon]|nr:biotin/lipoyl-containing protein [archaeon]
MFISEAARCGYPVLLKAAAGGGGKGMRVVRAAGEMGPAMELARSEAQRSFGDPRLLLERYLEEVRHVEVQVLGDAHGHLMHLYERECSVQRRHQKLVEESPSPMMTPALRSRMTKAALAVARMIAYSGAGTVEFVVDAKTGAFFFLEVNTRLQVEHPVTEQVLSLDLVELQIRVAERVSLPSLFPHCSPDPDPALPNVVLPPPLRGHAIELRLCAEDPSSGFLPCTGPVLLWSPASAEGLRFDGDLRAGQSVSIHFDPLLCKLIATGHDRPQALRRAVHALRHSVLLGVVCNKEFLLRLLSHPLFQAGLATTGFIDATLSSEPLSLMPPAFPQPLSDRTVLAAAAFAHQWTSDAQSRSLLRHLPSGWRNSPSRLLQRRFQWPAEPSAASSHVHYQLLHPRSPSRLPLVFQPFRIDHHFSSSDSSSDSDATLLFSSAASLSLFPSPGPHLLSFALDTQRYTVHAIQGPDGALHIHCAALELVPTASLQPVSLLSSSHSDQDSSDASYVAPMPSRILQLHFADGASLSPGDPVLTIESMKMEVRILAKKPGRLQLYVSVGQLVDAGVEMFSIV